MSMLPRASVLTVVDLVAAMVALAGLVPCAVSGMTIFLPLFVLAAVAEVGAHQHQPGELALRACCRLQRDGVQPGDLGQDVLQLPAQPSAPCARSSGLVGVQVAEPGQRREPLVDLGLCFIVQEPSG